MPTPRSEFFSGVRATLPLVAGDVPFGLIYGVQGAAAHVPPLIILAMSSVIFAGSAQLIAVNQMGAVPPVPYSIMVLTNGVVNLRHMLYGATLGPQLRGLGRRWKLVLAYLLTDETFAVTSVRYQQLGGEATRHWFYLGTGLTVWISWQIVTLAGVLIGGQVPERWALDFAVPLTFIGLIMPTLRDRALVAAAAAAGLAAVLANSLPLRLGLIVAAAVGILTGLLVESLTGGLRPAAAPAADAEPDPPG